MQSTTLLLLKCIIVNTNLHILKYKTVLVSEQNSDNIFYWLIFFLINRDVYDIRNNKTSSYTVALKPGAVPAFLLNENSNTVIGPHFYDILLVLGV